MFGILGREILCTGHIRKIKTEVLKTEYFRKKLNYNIYVKNFMFNIVTASHFIVDSLIFVWRKKVQCI